MCILHRRRIVSFRVCHNAFGASNCPVVCAIEERCYWTYDYTDRINNNKADCGAA